MTDHDSGYKRIFSHPRLVQELLRFLSGLLRGRFLGQLDVSSLQKVGASFVSDRWSERHSDAVWRLRWRGRGRQERPDLYLLLEFQSTPDPLMPLRLLDYASALLLDVAGRERRTPGQDPPVVLPVVLYNGKRPWRAARRVEALYRDVPSGLSPYLPRFRYVLVDEGRLAPDLVRPGNIVAAIFRLEAAEPAEVGPLVRELGELLRGEPEELRRDLKIWVLRLLRRIVPGITISETAEWEDLTMLEETLSEWFEKARKEGRREGRKEGRQEGRKEGQAEGMRQMLVEQLEERFGPLPAGARRQVEATSSAKELGRLARRVLTAGSLAELGLGSR